MEIEFTTGFLMFWGGIALSAASVIGLIIYLCVTRGKAKRLLKQINDEMQ